MSIASLQQTSTRPNTTGIENAGSKFTTRKLDPSEHLTEIKKKLYEEVQEFRETMNRQDTLEELADILELIHAAPELTGLSIERILEIKANSDL